VEYAVYRQEEVVARTYDASNLNLEAVLAAAERGFEGGNGTALETILEAASAMPLSASDFDRGIAAGIALERWRILHRAVE